MKGILGLIKRNLLLYFKDVQTVIFSLLTSIIVFVLYILFLKNQFVNAINSAMNGLEAFINQNDIDSLVSGILLTGIMGSALITVSFNCLTTIVKDRERKIDYDISATPMKRWQIIVSYFTSAVISSFIMTSVIFTFGIVLISLKQNLYLGFADMLKIYGLIAFGSLSATALFMIVMLFFKTSSASGAFFGMLSAAAGFVIGAYLPVSEFSDSVQTVCNLFPASHVTITFRKLLLSNVLDKITLDIGGLDEGMFTESIKETFTFNPSMFSNVISTGNSMLYVALFAVVSIIVMVCLYAKTYKRK